MNPLANLTFLGYTLTLLGFALTLLGFLIPLFFYVIPLKGYTMQHEMQHEKIQWIFVFCHLTNKIFVSSQLCPKSSQNLPNSKGLSYHFGSWILGHFGRSRTFSDIFGKICYQIPLLCYQSALFCEVMALLRFRSKTHNYHATITQLRHIDKLQAS